MNSSSFDTGQVYSGLHAFLLSVKRRHERSRTDLQCIDDLTLGENLNHFNQADHVPQNGEMVYWQYQWTLLSLDGRDTE